MNKDGKTAQEWRILYINQERNILRSDFHSNISGKTDSFNKFNNHIIVFFLIHASTNAHQSSIGHLIQYVDIVYLSCWCRSFTRFFYTIRFTFLFFSLFFLLLLERQFSSCLQFFSFLIAL